MYYKINFLHVFSVNLYVAFSELIYKNLLDHFFFFDLSKIFKYLKFKLH